MPVTIGFKDYELVQEICFLIEYYIFKNRFRGHLSHSADLLLWVSVCHRLSSVIMHASYVVHRPLIDSSQKLLGQS